MDITRDQFSSLLITAIGADGGLQWLRDWFTHWGRIETNPLPGAQFNVWNTTLRKPGSTFYNCLSRNADGSCRQGVQNYLSLADGIAANASVLLNAGYYLPIIDAARRGDRQALSTPSATVKRALHIWVRGPNNPAPSYEGTTSTWIAQGATERNEIAHWTGTSGIDATSPQITTPSDNCIAHCGWAAGMGPVYAVCLGLCASGGLQNVATTAANTGNNVAGFLDSVNNVFNWLTSRQNWLRILKGLIGLLALSAGIVLGIIAVSEKAQNSEVGKKVVKVAELSA